MAREIDDQSIAKCAARQSAPGTAWRNGETGICRGEDDVARLLRGARKGDGGRFDLIERRVGRIKLAGAIIEGDIAIGRREGPLLSRSHWPFNILRAGAITRMAARSRTETAPGSIRLTNTADQGVGWAEADGAAEGNN